MKTKLFLLLALAACSKVPAGNGPARGEKPTLTLVSVTPSVIVAGTRVTISYSASQAGASFVAVDDATGPRLLARNTVEAPGVTVSATFDGSELVVGKNDVVVSLITPAGGRGTLVVPVTRGGGPERSVGGTVTGLQGTGLVLALDLPAPQADQFVNLSTSGSFVFPTSVLDGTVVNRVTVNVLPTSPTQSCVVLLANGDPAAGFTVSGGNFTDLRVTCASVAANLHAVGGTVSGLKGGGLLLFLDLPGSTSDQLQPLVVNGAFTFGGLLADGTTVTAVTVIAIPTAPTQTCTVKRSDGSPASGFTIGSTDFTDLRVTCADAAQNARAVGGTVTGLEGIGLTLALDAVGTTHDQTATIVTNGAFTFAGVIPDGTAITSVTASAQPVTPGQTCTVTLATGGAATGFTIGSSDFSDLRVTCVTNAGPQPRNIGGTVSGLFGTGLTLALNAPGTADDQTLPITGDGPFVFSAPIVEGTVITAVTASAQPTLPTQTCTVMNGTSFTVPTGSDYSSLVVTCSARHPSEVPVIFFTDITSGPSTGGVGNNGAFITIYGERFGNSRPKVTIGGVEVAAYGAYGTSGGDKYGPDKGARKLDRIFVQPGGAVANGVQPIVVYRDGRSPSNSVNFEVAAGNIYFVDNAAADDLSATPTNPATPWKTLGKASNTAVRGDIVYVRGGTYSALSSCTSTSALLCYNSSAGGLLPVAFVGYPGEDADIAAANSTDIVGSLRGTVPVVLANLIFGPIPPALAVANRKNSFSVRTSLRFAANRFGEHSTPSLAQILVDGASSSFIVLGNFFGRNSTEDNIRIENTATIATLAEVAYNEFTGATKTGAGFGANVALHDPISVVAFSAHHNLFAGGIHDLFLQNGNYDDAWHNAPGHGSFGQIGTIDVFDNVFLNTPGSGFPQLFYADLVSGDVTIAHNTIYLPNISSTALKIAYFGAPTGPVQAFHPNGIVANNAVYAGDNFYEYPVPSGTTVNQLTFLANLYTPGAETTTTDAKKKSAANPQWTNPGLNDFSLTSASTAAIDQGDSAILGGVVIDTDYLGFPRPLGAERDIGAFEYVPP